VEIIRRAFGRYGQGKVLETTRSRQDRAEGVCGGAGKHCYVKSVMSGGYGKNCGTRADARGNPAHTDRVLHQGFRKFQPLHVFVPPAGAFFSPAGHSGLQNRADFSMLRTCRFPLLLS